MTRCYLAHPITEYGGSERQAMAVSTIKARGWTVVTPDEAGHQEAYEREGMSHFISVVETCDVLAFLRFPNGTIGAGVWREIETMFRLNRPVFEVETGKLKHISSVVVSEILSVEETRAMITSLKGA